jgi:predicted small secreted protein
MMARHGHWVVVVVMLAALSVAGCNTIRGMGQDVEAAGGAIAGTAEDTQQRLRRP